MFRFAARWPLGLLQCIGAGVGRLVRWLDSSVRRRIDENLRQAGYPASMAGKVAAELGKSFFELPAIWLRPLPDALALAVEISGAERVTALHRDGRPIMVVTPHLGSFELVGQWLAANLPVTIMYRAPKLQWLEPLMRAGRGRGNARLCTADLRGVRAMLKALRSGECIGLLPDQAPGNGEGVWAPFFNRPAYTMTLVGRLQASTGAAVFMVIAERLARGRGFHMHFVELPTLPEDPAAAAAALNASIETMVRRFPEQYLWSYNRYKVPAGVAAPGASPSAEEGA